MVAGTVTGALSWSSSPGTSLSGVEFGSAWSTAVTSAEFVRSPVPLTVPVIVSVATPVLARLGTDQTGAVQVPADGVTVTPDSCEGTASVTSMLVAVSGPLLVSVTVYVIVSPTDGVASSTVLVRLRSASCGVTSALSWSSSAGASLAGVEFGSNWSAALTWAVLVFAPSVSTVALMSSVADPPLSSSPTVQTPELWS